jgi:hypothetical protein
MLADSDAEGSRENEKKKMLKTYRSFFPGGFHHRTTKWQSSPEFPKESGSVKNRLTAADESE